MKKGNVIPVTYYGMSRDFPADELLVTVIFEVQATRTKLTLRHLEFPPATSAMPHGPGGTSPLTSMPVSWK